MNEFSTTLYTRINEILFYLWDPIGVRYEYGARDEYDTYANHVYSLIINGGDQKAVSTYLSRICTEHIGLENDADATEKIAELLFEIKDFLTEKMPADAGDTDGSA